LGYYCAQEFQVFEPLRAEMIELGCACVHPQHRNLVVLGLAARDASPVVLARNSLEMVALASAFRGRFILGLS